MVKINRGKCPDLAQRSVVANNIEVRLTNTDYADFFLYCQGINRSSIKGQKYDKMAVRLKLMCELNAGRKSGEKEGWISAGDVRSHFRERANV